MAYHLCSNDHYVNGSEGATCPAKGCQAKLGGPVPRDGGDPRGDDPFFYGKTASAQAAAGAPVPTMRFTSPAQVGHALCETVFPNIKAFHAHLPNCEGADDTERDRLYNVYARR